MGKPRRQRCKICKKTFTPKFDTKTVRQVVCSNSCCVLYYDKQKPKSRKLARIVSAMVGMRSMGEVQFASEHIDTNKKKLKAAYEPDTFAYEVSESRAYTPDFRVTLPSGKVYYIEYKGVLDNNTRKKMKLVKMQHPKIDIRFVFQRAANKIRKGSKTTYGKWADQWGFKWADNRIPALWLKK